MFVKLQWTQDKHISQIFKLITYIVNTPSVAAVSDITTALTAVGTFNSQASVYAGWDPTNSYIYRTGTGNNALTTANTVAKFGKFNTNLYAWNFFLEQTAYDNASHKTLYSLMSTSNTLTAANIYSAHRQSTSGSLITSIGTEATTTNTLNSAGVTATGFNNAGLGTAITFPVTVASTTVTTNIVTVAASTLPIPICRGMKFIVTGTTYGGLAAGTYVVATVSAANTFTVSSADYGGNATLTATTLSTYSGPFTGATYTMEVAMDSESAWISGTAQTATQIATSTIENRVRTAWFYITDNCFLWSLADSTGGTTGVPASTNLAAINSYIGPHFQAQYTRTDPWNTSANGILPWIRTNPYRLSTGTHLGSTTLDLTNLVNVLASNVYGALPLLADGLINASPSTTATSWLKYYYQPINFGAGARYNEFTGLTASANGNAGAVQTSGGANSASSAVLQTSAGVRWWSADLTKKTYMMLPITWRSNAYNVSGGNITDRTGIYWFNGDYYPGDTLTYNSKTYVLMPLGLVQNDTYRVAFAIPRE